MDQDVARMVDAVEPWLTANGVPGDGLSDVRLLPGGTQNVAMSFVRGGGRFVLRSGPRHPRPHTNRNLLREMRFLEA